MNLYNPQNEIEKENISELLQRFNVICRTISHTNYIKVDEFETYCYDTLEFMKTKFKFMPIPKSLHKTFAHCAQKIRENGGQSLGHKSEGPLEGLHKFLRLFRMRLARFCSTRENFIDVFKRLWMKNNALVRKQRPIQSKRGSKKPKSADDLLVESFIISDE